MAGALRRKWDGERLSTVPASREFARIVTTAQVQKLADHEVPLSIRQGCMPGSRHDVGGSRNDGISRVTSSAWVLAIAWALMLIFGIPRFRELWRGPSAFSRDYPGWRAYLRAGLAGVVGMSFGVAAMLVAGIATTLGLLDPAVPLVAAPLSGTKIVLSILLVGAGMSLLCALSIHLFNWPKFAIPPHMRADGPRLRMLARRPAARGAETYRDRFWP